MKFKKKNASNEIGEMSTAALPDIVFMLLFFFMVTTVMRPENPLVRVDKPNAQEVAEIEDQSTTATIYIGPDSDVEGTVESSHIQIGKQLVALSDVGELIATKRESLPENLRRKFTVVIKADKHVRMGTITKVKQELKKVQAYKIQYSTLPAFDDDMASLN